MTDDEGKEILSRLQAGWKFLLGKTQPNGDYELRELYGRKTGGFAVRDTLVPSDANTPSRTETKALDAEHVLTYVRGLDFNETKERLRPPPKAHDAAIELSPDLSRPHRVIGVFQVPAVSVDEAILQLRDVARREGADAIDAVRQRQTRMWEGTIVRWVSA